MSEPFLAEVKMVGFNFAPRGWAFCDGQILPINQNQALFSLIGTTYGGDGRTTFALPDLRGRTPIHEGQVAGGSNRTLGERSGEEAVTLSVDEIPSHSHTASASNLAADTQVPQDNLLASSLNVWAAPSATVQLAPETVGPGGAGQDHVNMQPYLTVHFCIALQGIFPSRN
jgi:microcystin-dependent protein